MKRIILVVVCFFITACGTVNMGIGTGAVTVKQVATLVQRECGNTQPNGPCLSTSRISTAEKNEFKIRLQQAQDALTDANRLKAAGREAESGDKLQLADGILASLEQILISRGIE